MSTWYSADNYLPGMMVEMITKDVVRRTGLSSHIEDICVPTSQDLTRYASEADALDVDKA